MLQLPEVKGADEYRIYFNERTEMRPESGEDGEETEVEVTVYDYVSVLSEQEPTDDEWREVLSELGHSKTEINKILKG